MIFSCGDYGDVGDMYRKIPTADDSIEQVIVIKATYITSKAIL